MWAGAPLVGSGVVLGYPSTPSAARRSRTTLPPDVRRLQDITVAPTSRAGRGRGLSDPTGLALRPITPRCPPPTIKVSSRLAQDSLGVNFKVELAAPPDVPLTAVRGGGARMRWGA